MQRICIVGNSGSGKTHLARRVARQLGLPHVDLDGLDGLNHRHPREAERWLRGLHPR